MGKMGKIECYRSVFQYIIKFMKPSYDNDCKRFYISATHKNIYSYICTINDESKFYLQFKILNFR